MSEDISFHVRENTTNSGIFSEIYSPNPPKDKIKEVTIDNLELVFQSNPILYWGRMNAFPQEILPEIEKCSVLEIGLKVLADFCLGQDLYYYTESIDETGNRVVKEIIDEEIESWLRNSRFTQFLDKATREYFKWGNIFPIYMLNTDKKVALVDIKDTPFMRLEKPNTNSFEIENVYYSQQWGKRGFTVDIATLKNRIAIKLPLLGEFGIPAQLATGNQFTYCQHIKMHSSGSHYGRAPWHAAYLNGWVGISSALPEMKKRLFNDSITINYIVYVHKEYWLSKYGQEWNTYSPEKRIGIIEEFQKSVEKNLVGKKNAYNTIFSSMDTTRDGSQIKTVEIVTIDNKLREGNLIPESHQADYMVLTSLGLDPNLMGVVIPGGKSSGGSGSNIREAMIALQGRLRPDRENILQILYNVAEVNGWTKKYTGLKFWFKDWTINTLDNRQPAAGAEVVVN